MSRILKNIGKEFILSKYDLDAERKFSTYEEDHFEDISIMEGPIDKVCKSLQNIKPILQSKATSQDDNYVSMNMKFDDFYDGSQLLFTIKFKRVETDDEVINRLMKLHRNAINKLVKEEKEKREYFRLKTKFEKD
jgi:hypothetical protein